LENIRIFGTFLRFSVYNIIVTLLFVVYRRKMMDKTKISKKRWLPEEIKLLTEAVEMGGSCSAIAVLLDRTTRSVQHKFNELGLEKPKLCVGDHINRLTILELYDVYEHHQHKTYAKCQCDCGNETKAKLTAIKRGSVKSCGCLKREKASQRLTEYNAIHGHGLSDSRLYKIWYGMKNRCFNTKQWSYKDYGGRGITICDEWLKDFKVFYDWAMSHGYKANLTIDRIDSNGNYEPSNCRWATNREQAANKRNSCSITITAFKETKSIYEWLHDSRCVLDSVGALAYRICAGWPSEKAITKPSERKKQ